MSTLNHTTATLPAFWSSPLINGDWSGLEDHDVAMLKGWLELNQLGNCLTCTEEPSFRKWHDANAFVLACDCLEFTFTLH